MIIYCLGLSWSLSSILFLWYYFIDIIRLYCLLKMDNSSKNLKKIDIWKGILSCLWLDIWFPPSAVISQLQQFWDRQTNDKFLFFPCPIWFVWLSFQQPLYYCWKIQMQPIWFNWSVRRLLWCLFFLWLQKYTNFLLFSSVGVEQRILELKETEISQCSLV